MTGASVYMEDASFYGFFFDQAAEGHQEGSGGIRSQGIPS
jgi:hypothetical protein